MTKALSLRRLHDLLSQHRRLVTDATRNRAFRRALERTVKPGSRVLDIGCGTGLWAILAARLGARKVVAVEREPLLLPIVRQLARDNGVLDRIDVVAGDSRRLRLAREFDVVVSETLGNAAYDEQIVPILADARRRFLRPGGVTIPSAVSLVAAPARVAWPGSSLPLRLSLLEGLWACFAHVDVRARVRTLARARRLAHTPLLADARTPSRRRLTASWDVTSGRLVNAVVLWVEAELAPGVVLRTLRGTQWDPILLPVGPLASGKARLRLRLALQGLQSRWEVTATDRAGWTETASASPLFAYGWVESRLGSAGR